MFLAHALHSILIKTPGVGFKKWINTNGERYPGWLVKGKYLKSIPA